MNTEILLNTVQFSKSGIFAIFQGCRVVVVGVHYQNVGFTGLRYKPCTPQMSGSGLRGGWIRREFGQKIMVVKVMGGGG